MHKFFKQLKQRNSLNSYNAAAYGVDEAVKQAQKTSSTSFLSGRQQAAFKQIPSQVTAQKQGSSPASGAAKFVAKRLGF